MAIPAVGAAQGQYINPTGQERPGAAPAREAEEGKGGSGVAVEAVPESDEEGGVGERGRATTGSRGPRWPAGFHRQYPRLRPGGGKRMDRYELEAVPESDEEGGVSVNVGSRDNPDAEVRGGRPGSIVNILA